MPLTAPTSLLLVCSVCLLDDAMFLVVVGAALVVALTGVGAMRLMAVAERLALRDRG